MVEEGRRGLHAEVKLKVLLSMDSTVLSRASMLFTCIFPSYTHAFMQITRSSIPWSTIIPISFDDRRELSLFCKERCSFKTLFLSLNIVYSIIYENFLILMSECLRELEELLIFSSFELDESD